MRLTESGLIRQQLAAGHFLRVVRDEVVLPDGNKATRELVIHPGAVMVVPLMDDGQVVLERQFRYPVGRVLVEFPAGKLDLGESSLTCAKRELAEETGYVASEWAFAGVLHPLAAYSTEHIDVWFARGLTAGPQHLDPGEFLEVFSVTVSELLVMARTGEVTDAKTLVAALWLQNVQAGDWTLNWLDAQSDQHPSPAGPYCPPLAEAR